MARGGSRGRRSSYVRDNSGRFASTPGGGPPKRSTPASRRAARAKVTGGTLGARGSLRRSRAKLAAKNPADRSLRGSLSLRAQKGAVTKGANRLGKVRAASTVRMAGKGPAGVIRGGRKVVAKPVAAQPKLAAAKRIGSPRPSGTVAKPRNLKPGAIAARKAKAAASGARGARATTNYNRAQKVALEAQQRVNRRRSPKNLAALARADQSLKTAARAYRILVGLGGEKMAVARKPSPKGAGPRMKAARPAGTVVKPRGLKAGKLSAKRRKRMKPYSRISASGQDLARRWARAGEAARRRGIDGYAGPPNRKKAERAATVDAAARAFRGAMAGAPGLRYRNAMSRQDTQQKAEKTFRARPRFSTRQRVKKGWN